MAAAFTMFEKFGDVCAALNEADRKELMYAICMYGMYGTEVELPYLLKAIFISLKEDIDNSKESRKRGSSGGRPRKKPEVSEDVKPAVSETGKQGVSEEAKPPVSDHAGKTESQTKPDQTSPVQSKPEVVKRKRFKPPTPEEVDAYAAEWCRANGYDPSGFSGGKFVDFYASKGWMVGRSPMKDWKAAARNWIVKDCRKGARNEYSDF